jgi:trk system potassium uptake protein TrkH
MRYRAISRIIGTFLIIHSLGLIPPILISYYYVDGQLLDFVYPLIFSFALGLSLWLPFRNEKSELRRHEGFLIVAAYWFILSAVSALPFIIGPHLNFVDSFFEAASAFTTTGSTVITDLNVMPRSILFYRQELQWLGGMGIIVLAVAILPLLRMGGMQLYRAETPGPLKDEKFTPRIAHTASIFWMVYFLMTLSCALLYWLAGMTFFDAICHSMSTVSTGGFSTHNESISYFKSFPIELITVFFMYFGALNFSVHYIALHKKNLKYYFSNPEILVFSLIIFIAISIISLKLYSSHTYETYFESFRHTLFMSISVITSTGYTTENFTLWPAFTVTLLFFLSFIGGCSGSTAGGMKVIRIMLLIKQGYREIIRLIHPAIIMPLKIKRRIYDDSILTAVWGYFALYVAVFTIAILILMLGGLDQITAFSAVSTSLNNLGPGLGDLSLNFQSLSDWHKIVLAICMLLGRLELYTIIIIITPAFWRR